MNDATTRLTEATPHQRALERLQASRLRLAQHLLPAPATDTTHTGEPGAAWPAGLGRWFERVRAWLAGTPAAPVWQSAQAVGQRWWQQQPWRPGAEAAGDAVRARVAPWVRRHPWLSVGLAAGAAAAVVVYRPWQRPWVRTQARQAGSRLGRWLARELSAVPFHTLVPALIAAWSAHAAGRASAEAAEAQAQAQADAAQAEAQSAAAAPVRLRAVA